MGGLQFYKLKLAFSNHTIVILCSADILVLLFGGGCSGAGFSLLTLLVTVTA